MDNATSIVRQADKLFGEIIGILQLQRDRMQVESDLFQREINRLREQRIKLLNDTTKENLIKASLEEII